MLNAFFLVDENYYKLEEILLSWLGTPYHAGWCQKSIGCDCSTFVGSVLRELGILSFIEVDFYPNHWWHQYEDLIFIYLEKHKKYLHNDLEVIQLDFSSHLDLLRGDIIHLSTLKDTKIINHSAFFLEDCSIIHAVAYRGVTQTYLNENWIKRIKRITRIIYK